jgi:hypothetical protein
MGFCDLLEFSMTKIYSQNSISFAPLSLKIYKIISTKSYSLSLLLKECALIFPQLFQFLFYLNFNEKKFSTFNYTCISI